MPDADQAKTIGGWVLGIVAACVVVAFGNWLSSFASSDQAFADKLTRIDDRLALMQSSSAGSQKDIEWIKRSITDIYTSKEAERAHQKILRTDTDQYDRIDRLNRNMRQLGGRVSQLENK